MTNYIWCTTSKEMFHAYVNAPEEVSFLSKRHRHIFYFKVQLEVTHDDRDVEFILFKRWVDEELNTLAKEENVGSCEMICNWLAKQIGKEYPNRKIKIEVSEDGENGALYEFV